MLVTTTRGAGPLPLLLLHGFLGSGRNLTSLARRYSERAPRRALVIADLPGHGASPPLPEQASLATVATEVVRLGASLCPTGRLDMIGHSLGGRVALAARQLAPERVGAVAIIDISPRPLPPADTVVDHLLSALQRAPAAAESREVFRQFFADAGLLPALVDWLLLNLTPRAGGGVTWRFDREALAAFDARARSEDLWPAVAQADTPTLCVRGGRSPFVPDDDARRLAALGVEVVTIPEASHFVHVDAQAALLDALVPFFQRSAGRHGEVGGE